MPSLHEPVLFKEVIESLKLKPNDNVVDGTVGGGGHLTAILKAVAPRGLVLGIDADPKAIELVKKKFPNEKRLILINSWFSEIQKYVLHFNLEPVVAILLDLGWSSDQLADAGRGFSFKAGGQLDLRFNPQTYETAEHILNTATEQNLGEIFKNFGDEPRAKSIAREIVTQRQVKPLESVNDLLDVVGTVYKNRFGKIHPATKIWQALRIAVNNELDQLAKTLPIALSTLGRGGRLAVISFHSGEDRIVKRFFLKESKDCLCPPGLPVCRCGHIARLKLVTTKAIKPSEQEININPRSRSARLRVVEKI